jgi:hypothetical protein
MVGMHINDSSALALTNVPQQNQSRRSVLKGNRKNYTRFSNTSIEFAGLNKCGDPIEAEEAEEEDEVLAIEAEKEYFIARNQF